MFEVGRRHHHGALSGCACGRGGQVFLGGLLIGGAKELEAALADGSFQDALDGNHEPALPAELREAVDRTRASPAVSRTPSPPPRQAAGAQTLQRSHRSPRHSGDSARTLDWRQYACVHISVYVSCSDLTHCRVWLLSECCHAHAGMPAARWIIALVLLLCESAHARTHAGCGA